MKLYDTAKRAYVEFKPDKTVKIYVCGITPYDSAHLGHVFTFMIYDLLQRRLEDLGHTVEMVRNITDVDEPIYSRASELGIPYTTLAKQETARFQSTMQTLNFRVPYAQPLASEYIDDMAVAVAQLLKNDFAYYVGKDIYFDVSRYPDFAQFSGFDERLLLGLSALRGGDPERSGKRQPLDFLLWKSISDTADPAQWQTPIGNGRPGWHIECSVMAAKLLDTPFDVHGGGSDLVFPHHSAEIAQSYGLNKSKLAKYWVHVYPMLSDGEKMSKSLGNLIFAQDLLETYEPAVIRLALMHYHHRIGGEWQSELLREASHLLKKLHKATSTVDTQSAEILLDRVRAALDDDLNTLEVIDAIHSFVVSCQHGRAAHSQAKAIVDEALDLLGLR